MQFKRLLYVAVLLALFSSCQGPRATRSTTPGNNNVREPRSFQILYVIDGLTVITYSVDTDDLSVTVVGSAVNLLPKDASLIQFLPSAGDRFLYVLWSDASNQQYLSAYAIAQSGVPRTPAIQTLYASLLSQLNIDASGRFAYMLEVNTVNGEYTADIRLFHVDPQTGLLSEDPQVQGSYGPAIFLPAQLYGMSADGTGIYDTTAGPSGSDYRERLVDPNAGTLGPDIELYRTTTTSDVVIGSNVIIEHLSSFYYSGAGYLDVSPNMPWPTQPVIHCTRSMLNVCDSATNVQLDPSGKYLFLTDASTQKIRVAALDLVRTRVVDTGNSFPMTEQTPGFTFSQDGKLIYATLATDRKLHIFGFDSRSGTISAGGTPVVLPSTNSGICPATQVE